VFGGKRHFRDIMKSPEGIASNILAARLKKLETRGLISRRIDPQSRKQIVYELTDKGLELVPILIDIIAWGAKHDPKTAAPRSFLERIKKDRDGLIRETISSIRRPSAARGRRSK
jgi:DNA-binding HxlR family transcriptional regulator